MVVSPSDKFSRQAAQAKRLLSPPAGLYRPDKPVDQTTKALRKLGRFSAFDYAKAFKMGVRRSRERINKLVIEGIVEYAGYDLRQGSGRETRVMQIFKLKGE